MTTEAMWRISTLEHQITELKRSLAHEESQKLDALKSFGTEKEARIALGKERNSLREELDRAQQDALKVKTLEDKNKMLQETNMKLENQFEVATNAIKNLEKEKDMIIFKYNITLEKLCRLYEAQIADAKDSSDDAIKQKEN